MNGGEWVLPGAAALLIGISKTSVGGLAAIAVAVFASVMPAKESTAAVLLLLLTGDVVAVARYRRGADWGLLRRLLPSVVPGLALGAVFLWFVSDTVVRRSIAEHPLAAVIAGVLAGFATMTANAAGAVMTLYLLAMRVEKVRFIGTSAWFFLIVNVSKLPFSASLGLFPAETLRLSALLAPVVLVGTWLGILSLRRSRCWCAEGRRRLPISGRGVRSGNLVGGGVSERPKEHASKACVGGSPPRVRIPAPPPVLDLQHR